MPVPVQYQGYQNKPPKGKNKLPVYNPAKRISGEYQQPSPAYRVMQEYRAPSAEVMQRQRALEYMYGARPTYRPPYPQQQVVAQPSPYGGAPPQYQQALNRPSPATLTKRYTRPTQEGFTYVNIPRMQGPPISMAGGNTGMLPARKSNLLASSRGGGGYGYGGYGGGYGGGGWVDTPQAGYVRPAPRLNQAAAPFVGQRAAYPQEYASSPGREVMGIPAPQRNLPRWYRNLTSWRV